MALEPHVAAYTIWAPMNIAVLKYWGKRDPVDNIPLNDSISVTLDGVAAPLGTRTTIQMRPAESDSIAISINGVDYTDCLARKIERIMDGMRQASCIQTRFQVSIASENFSPTASGLASSASGFAALTAALGLHFKLPINTGLSRFARLGSGSAARSMAGGFVKWTAAGDADTCAVQLHDEFHWPQLRCIIVHFNSHGQKEVSSTEGMRRSVATSRLLQCRIEPEGMAEKARRFEEALREKDFCKLGPLIMQDSNQFHAVCLDTYPPLLYLAGESHRVIKMVHRINEAQQPPVAAYTFDAGPHPVLFLLEQNLGAVLAELQALGLDAKIIECRVSGGPRVC